MVLPSPARYTPWLKGVYEVAPALRPFGTDFGNGHLDRQVFQIDSEWERFRASKGLALRRRSLHVGRQGLSPIVESAVCEWISARLAAEQPMVFAADDGCLHSRLTGDSVSVADLDAVCGLVQEDLAVVSTQDGEDWISYVNVCSPSHWNPSEKLGLSFFTGHEVVPGFERVNKGAAGLVKAMVEGGPWVRFVWGIETDDRLNHHPVAPEGVNPIEWNGRLFDRCPFWVRTERQTIWGLPQAAAAVFVIRVHTLSSESVTTEECEALLRAVESMSPEALRYKGLDVYHRALIEQLRRSAGS